LEQRRALALLQRWLGELLQQRAGGSGDALQRRPALQPPGTETAETRGERGETGREMEGRTVGLDPIGLDQGQNGQFMCHVKGKR